MFRNISILFHSSSLLPSSFLELDRPKWPSSSALHTHSSEFQHHLSANWKFWMCFSLVDFMPFDFSHILREHRLRSLGQQIIIIIKLCHGLLAHEIHLKWSIASLHWMKCIRFDTLSVPSAFTIGFDALATFDWTIHLWQWQRKIEDGRNISACTNSTRNNNRTLRKARNPKW